MSARMLGRQFTRPGGRRSAVNLVGATPSGQSPPPSRELTDSALQGLAEKCPDCKAAPFQPCHDHCSSRWT